MNLDAARINYSKALEALIAAEKAVERAQHLLIEAEVEHENGWRP